MEWKSGNLKGNWKLYNMEEEIHNSCYILCKITHVTVVASLPTHYRTNYTEISCSPYTLNMFCNSF